MLRSAQRVRLEARELRRVIYRVDRNKNYDYAAASACNTRAQERAPLWNDV